MDEEKRYVPMWLFQRAVGMILALAGLMGLGMLTLLFMYFDLKVEIVRITAGIQVAAPKVDESTGQLRELIGLIKAKEQQGKAAPIQ